MIPDVPGARYVVRVAGGAQPARWRCAAPLAAAAGAASVPLTQVPERRLPAVPRPPPAADRATPLRRVPRLLSIRLAAGAARGAAARLAHRLRRQTLRVRAMRSVVPLPLRVRKTSRTKPPRASSRRQIIYVRRLRHAVPLPQVVQEAPT